MRSNLVQFSNSVITGSFPVQFHKVLRFEFVSFQCLKDERIRIRHIIDDDWNNYYLQIPNLPKNTTIEISVISGNEGYDAETRWSNEQIYRLAKLSHTEFALRKSELIQDAIEYANNLFGSTRKLY